MKSGVSQPWKIRLALMHLPRRSGQSGLVVVLVGGFAACAAPVWDHPTKGMAAFEQDQRQCAQQAAEEEQAIDPHTGASVPLHVRQRDCLHVRGYIERSH